MKTLILRNVTILSAFLCLSFNSFGQSPNYIRLLFGQASPYDTAVAIQITEYRAIRFKLSTAENLVRGLNDELRKSTAVIQNLEAVKINYELQLSSLEKSHRDDRQTIADLNKHIDDLVKLIPGKKPFYKSNVALMCYGAAIVTGLIKLSK